MVLFYAVSHSNFAKPDWSHSDLLLSFLSLSLDKAKMAIVKEHGTLEHCKLPVKTTAGEYRVAEILASRPPGRKAGMWSIVPSRYCRHFPSLPLHLIYQSLRHAHSHAHATRARHAHGTYTCVRVFASYLSSLTKSTPHLLLPSPPVSSRLLPSSPHLPHTAPRRTPYLLRALRRV